MHIPARRRPEFEHARHYEYPTHLSDAIARLPSMPGVYVFHGEEGQLPLYIGKSVNLRSRVLSHLRNHDEASLLRQTRKISHICTVGEIGALLLEASLIKQQQPLMNKKLRRIRQLCSLRVVDALPEVVDSKDLNFATEPSLYGLFSSRHSALETLRNLADQHRLCYGALGLEKLKPGRPCFRATLKQCGGVCRGDESAQAHRNRLLACLTGLGLACWPYAGAIGLVELVMRLELALAQGAGPMPGPSVWSSATGVSARSMSSATGASSVASAAKPRLERWTWWRRALTPTAIRSCAKPS